MFIVDCGIHVVKKMFFLLSSDFHMFSINDRCVCLYHFPIFIFIAV